jgi:CheY-like chemotaxis protein
MSTESKSKKKSGQLGAVPVAWVDYLFTFSFVFAAVIFGLVVVAWVLDKAALGILWSLGCMILGAIIGFLFGIPRVLQQDAVPLPVQGAGAGNPTDPTNSSPAYRQQVNTNLEQISDWLTKIIVGIGLVELRRLPELLKRASVFIANGLSPVEQNMSIAGGIIVYFVIIGFLSGYTVTRIYLAGAFKRADTGEGSVLNVGGNELDVEEALTQQGKLIKDLLDRSARSSQGTEEGAQAVTLEEKVISGEPLAVKTILWVDDNPKNNSYLIESLKNKGIEIVTATSTSDADAILRKRNFDRIITDMGRTEGGIYVEAAGINLIKDIREVKKSDVPIIVYCSQEAAAKYRNEALQAGATEISASPTFLLNALKLEG